MNDRVLGTIATICAPALLVEGIVLRGQENALITGIASMIFMAGWICSNAIMRRRRAAGTGKWGKAVLLIQLAGLVVAFAFGFFEATGLLGRDSVIFNVTDAAWPLSMLWMLVVGVAVIAAKRLPGWRRFVPFLCPFWLFLAIGATAVFGDAASYIGLAWSAIFWSLLGLVLRSNEPRLEASPEPALQ